MNLDKAIGILNYSEETGISEARLAFQEKASTIQFLADSTDSENLKELYLVQLTNLKKAWSQINNQKTDLPSETNKWSVEKDQQLNSQDISKVHKAANEALLNSQVSYAKQLYTKLSQLDPRNDYAFERIKFCNFLLSEYKKAERELERLKEIEAKKNIHISSVNISENETKERDWIFNTLLKNNSDDPDGSLSVLSKRLFLTGEGADYSSSGKKSRKKKKKEAVIFSTAILIFVLSVLSFAYRDGIGNYFESFNYKKEVDGTIIYSAEDYIEKADEHYENGNYVKALIQYSLASSVDTQNEYIQEQIAVCKVLIRQEQDVLPAKYVNNDLQEDTIGNVNNSLEIIDANDFNSDESLVNATNNETGETSEEVNTPQNEATASILNTPNETFISDTLIDSEVLDSLLLTDDSSFVANIEVEDIPEVEDVKKKNPQLTVQSEETKKRIISKANNRLQEDQEFLSKIYLAVDKRPEPLGGYDNFDEYLKRNMEYPKKAERNKIEGVVYVQFIVNRDGTISNAKTTTNLGYGLEEEAVRLIQDYPSWEPGLLNSRKVNVQTSLPIWFVNQ